MNTIEDDEDEEDHFIEIPSGGKDTYFDNDEDLTEVSIDESDIPPRGNIRPYYSFDAGLGDSFRDCPEDIYRSGGVVASSDIGKDATEAICEKLRRRGFRIDWHFSTGSGIAVKAIGDMMEITKAWKEEFKNYIISLEHSRFEYHSKDVIP